MKLTNAFAFVSIFLTFMPSYDSHAQDSLKVKHTCKWYVPDFAALQYAGSIGFISAGGGYNIGDDASVDFLFGYVPAFAGGASLETITLKFTGTLLKRIPVSRKAIINPLTMGAYFCYTAGRAYSSDLPSWYPDGYYWWSEALRVNVFIGGSGDIIWPKLKGISNINVYYELGTNEIKLVSYVQNPKALSLIDILHAGIGMRFYFRK